MNSQAVADARQTTVPEPAVADYLRCHGETGYRAFNLDVLHVEDGLIVEVTSFPPDLFGVFDRPQAP